MASEVGFNDDKVRPWYKFHLFVNREEKLILV